MAKLPSLLLEEMVRFLVIRLFFYSFFTGIHRYGKGRWTSRQEELLAELVAVNPFSVDSSTLDERD